jgi:hypothetical protein
MFLLDLKKSVFRPENTVKRKTWYHREEEKAYRVSKRKGLKRGYLLLETTEMITTREETNNRGKRS